MRCRKCGRRQVFRRQRGVTLLEALVALVLIASVGSALYGWINTSLTTLDRVRQSAERDLALRNAMEFIQTVNPMERQAGSSELGDVLVLWEADIADGPKDGTAYPSGPGYFVLALYDTRVRLEKEGEALGEFTLRQVGYRQVRSFTGE